jgi:hypothetical protein
MAAVLGHPLSGELIGDAVSSNVGLGGVRLDVQRVNYPTSSLFKAATNHCYDPTGVTAIVKILQLNHKYFIWRIPPMYR